MRILAIETSCDETGMTLMEARGGFTKPEFKIIRNIVSSQINVHAPFGGVVPNLAKREHLKNLPVVYKKIFGNQKKERDLWKKIDLIAVTTIGPGLEPALWTGINFAKNLGEKYKKPVAATSHLEGHIYSFLLPQRKIKKINLKEALPAVVLTVSGGHTILLGLESLKKIKKLGETRDDAAGEAFDKVARLLGLPYPGGPELEKIATGGDPKSIDFPRPMINSKNYDFSFSGLKTSVLYYLRDNPKTNRADVAASFQKAAVDVLVKKTTDAARSSGARKVKSIALVGGVAANKLLRKSLRKKAKELGVNFFVPDFVYNTDNAAMIGAAGYFTFISGKKHRLVAQGNPNI